MIINKGDLPIGSLLLTDIADENSAAFKVGRLRCAPQQIGLFSKIYYQKAFISSYLTFFSFCKEDLSLELSYVFQIFYQVVRDTDREAKFAPTPTLWIQMDQ